MCPPSPPVSPSCGGGGARQEGAWGVAVFCFKAFWGFGPPQPHYKRCQDAGSHPLSVTCCHRLGGLTMAAAFLLVLVVVGAAQAVVPPPCQGDPMSWCWDMDMAIRCGQEQQCQDLWDSLALGNVAEGDDMADGSDMADGDSVAQGRGIKCRLCTKALKKIQALAGDDPDEAAVVAALQKGCQVLGRAKGKLCQQLVKKYRDQITEALQNGDTPRDICTAMGICRS
ncbi:prosaposin-like isoform X1 [Corvus cornix cornix]|uniref:prosaposin-like isoform X1 n=1 Tax=Corvus brachyrhynchos TaxID=85066 RepID=UPI000534C5FD|nr:PREDICTED: prosaposin-like isoform X1 [Corvus brachyrhynchos]XP_010388150.1 prosaposin-like isoform X1 [Corvus cornix cornix]XP_010388151.1 prosaposin-like isoform X1 [Corvus cornix cornix]XP_017594269.1 PREDICTED: prosaposin-like isoform X1 [Corvus brachyrhynchos]